MSNQFEREVTVKVIGKYNSFSIKEGEGWYKPVGKDAHINDFEAGKTYKVKGYSSESGKTNYITRILGNGAPAEKPKRRLAPPPSPKKTIQPETSVEIPLNSGGTTGASNAFTFGRDNKPGDDKGFGKHAGRDFVKEAKGKTFSLIVAALCHNQDLGVVDILDSADALLKGIEERGYF